MLDAKTVSDLDSMASPPHKRYKSEPTSPRSARSSSKRSLVRMATTPSPIKPRIEEDDVTDRVVPLPDTYKAFYDSGKAIPTYVDEHGQTKEADAIVESNGFVCGLWVTPDQQNLWEWQSDVTIGDYNDVQSAARPTVVTKTVIRRKPAASPTVVMKKPMMADKSTIGHKTESDQMMIDDQIKFENSIGKTLKRSRKHVFSRVYHKMRTAMKNQGKDIGNLPQYVGEVLAHVEDVI